jgi:enoyl-[acyl-carrier-protein] reductase (NADH)
LRVIVSRLTFLSCSFWSAKRVAVLIGFSLAALSRLGGIARFDEFMNEAIARSPTSRLATIKDVGAAAAFLSSDVARNIAAAFSSWMPADTL